jgi:uncharacterized RDD family membrane protein YckC
MRQTWGLASGFLLWLREGLNLENVEFYIFFFAGFFFFKQVNDLLLRIHQIAERLVFLFEQAYLLLKY